MSVVECNYIVLLKYMPLFHSILILFSASQQSAVVYEVERWPHTPMCVGSNPSAAVDCLP